MLWPKNGIQTDLKNERVRNSILRKVFTNTFQNRIFNLLIFSCGDGGGGKAGGMILLTFLHFYSNLGFMLVRILSLVTK